MKANMITLSQLIDAIRQVAATEPGHTYNSGEVNGSSCDYLPNQLNRCGCIVGEALAILGVPRGKLAGLDELSRASYSTQWGSAAVEETLDGLVEQAALDSLWVTNVQKWQDDEWSWGGAVEQADRLAVANGWVMT